MGADELGEADRLGLVSGLDRLQLLVEGTSATRPEEVFANLTASLGRALAARLVILAETSDAGMAQTLATWPCRLEERSLEWEVAGTPLAGLAPGSLLHRSSDVRGEFPTLSFLQDLAVEGVLAASLAGEDGQTIGYLAAFTERDLRADAADLAMLRVLAARAVAELTRRRLQRTLGESEERLRDLFDEAPIAYVHEGLDSRFIRANRVAMQTLGITPDQVLGTLGMSFIPDTPEAQKRVQDAFASIGRGTDTSGVVLELRRRDNGKPLWIQWWSRPDPSGTSTRTMFIDITERVLLEQEQARLQAQNLYLQEEIKLAHNFEEIIGASPGLLRVLEDVKRVAPTDASVLITGETGTGKELIARAIHFNSRRRDKPLIKLNCAALPSNLVESELFGHEKGAFTGAIAQRIGRFELAHGGTIFLDEIGEVPLDVQVKLLRVIQEHEFERVGGNRSIRCDVRIIAATNRDLSRSIREGHFREDLYYRLNVFPIQLPPLRQRPGDLRLLVEFFLAKFCARIGKRIEGVTPETMARFEAYAWPGNVRELENFIERAVILATSTMLEATPESSIHPQARHETNEIRHMAAVGPSVDAPVATNLAAVGREHILATLGKTNWVIEGVSGAAQILGLHPNTLRSRMKKLGIVRPR